ncbi:hypothetical protein [Methanomethylophilus alvi]|uniref:hypothetical protein n=1 Tax=Methanomethylophilus alvi TaxID=1291540 RepID=UPI0037DD63D6
MESILTLYRTGIDPSRNLIIDSLDDYLATCESLRVEAFSIVRPVAEGEIKAALPQRLSVDPVALPPYDYLTVKQGDTTWRYYVSTLEQLATDTVKLHIALDVLNTIRPSDQDFSALSHCVRSLRNRYDGSNRPITEFSNEGIEATLVKTSETEFPMREGFLVYSMSEEAKPSLFALYDGHAAVANAVEITSDGFIRQVTLNPSGDATNLLWTFRRNSPGPMSWICGDKSWSGTADRIEFEGEEGTPSGAPPRLHARSYVGNTVVAGSSIYISIVTLTTVELPGNMTVRGFNGCSCNGIAPSTQSIGELDRTDTRLVKVVEVPYMPLSDDATYVIDKEFIRFLFSDVEPSLRTKVGEFDFDPAKYFKGEYIADASYWLSDPKLYCSQFFKCKVAYDNSAINVYYDNISLKPNGGDPTISVWFEPSTTLASSFLFSLENGGSFDWKNETESYPFVCVTDRNNELPLYTSDWINYLRNGCNYDKKRKAMEDATSWGSTAAGIATSVISILGGAGLLGSPGGAAASIPLIAGGISGLAGSAVGGITGQIGRNISYEQNLRALQLENYSVAGSNDLSLWLSYGKGCAKVETWEVIEPQRRQIADLFYMRGYAVNEDELPNTHVRRWFDYWEGVPKWNLQFRKKWSQEWLSLLDQAYAAGVTRLHKYQGRWDWEQVEHNWEI